ncbi:conserved exported protein of unknown function [Nitrospira japonica]|uniref:Uncharacterized protein n=1 Tax=Nitrospira japonica TaxID=1325564 RepID=A0A1W1I8W1_9BACT|nr:conserved exported protein of unknown function [Nitrospira japonica]
MSVQHRRLNRYISLCWSLAVLLIVGCASPPAPSTPKPIAQRLVGKSQTHIRQCAGQPAKEVPYETGVILRYYKEASTFVGSTTFLEGSQHMRHRGCWASLLIEQDQVTGVEFEPIPKETNQIDDLCDEMFRTCVP